MKRFIIVMTLLMTAALSGARAEFSLYAAEGTISAAQAQTLAGVLKEALDQEVELILEEETEERISQRVFAGDAPSIAVLDAQQAAIWARTGMLVPLDGCVEGIEHMAQELVDACVMDEQLMLAPLLAHRHVMAVRPDRFQAVNMDYLLGSRAHPVWYPSEFVQALDEMALLDRPGMDVWPPQDDDPLWLEALLQGVGDLNLLDPLTGAYAADEQGLENALEWLEDMLQAGLITAAADREEALERFLDGETAVFPDWTAAESKRYAQEIRQEEILLRPYPSLSGGQRHACKLVVLCAFSTGDEQEDAQSCRAVAAVLGADLPEAAAWRRSVYDDGAQCLPLLGAQEYGATLKALLCDAARAVISGEEDAQQAARRIDRAMRTMGW